MWEWIFVPLAYAVGSLSSAIIVCRSLNLPDPRKEGSNNPGATNVLRFGGKRAAAITLVGDLLKGLLPVLLVKAMGFDGVILAVTGVAAFLGHLYPVFFEFQGGKGVATGFGVFLGFNWGVALGAILAWVIMAKVVRISSLSALTAALVSPLVAWWLIDDKPLIVAVVIISALSIWRHKSNIERLLNGEEGKI